jgi:hypothetical protein
MISRTPAASWPLLPFEQYMLDDDRPNAPMTFTVVWRLAGHVDAERMRAAVENASRSHPLLGCRIRRGRWVPAAGGVPFRRVSAMASLRPDRESIDASRDACLRATLVEPAADCEEAELRLTFHHAACDGVGAMEFSGDIFAAYRGSGTPAAAPSRSRRDAQADPSLLDDRGRLERPIVPGATWRDAMRHFFAEGRRFMADRAVALPCERSGRSSSAADPVPVRFTSEETAALRRCASGADATLNELLLAVLVAVIGRHCAAATRHHHGAWLGVVQPVSMRLPRATRLPACNNIGYAFLRRPLVDCDDWQALLPGVVQDTRAVTRLGLAGCFNDAVSLLGRLPEPLRRPLVRAMRPGTFVFSYLGDPVRRFPRGLRGAGGDVMPGPGQAAGVDLGGCRVVDFSGAPPPRPGTELAILASLFGQQLTLWLRPSAALSGSVSWTILTGAIDSAVRSLIATEPADRFPRERHGPMIVAEGQG